MQKVSEKPRALSFSRLSFVPKNSPRSKHLLAKEADKLTNCRPRPIRSSTEPVEYSIDTGLSQKRKREAVARSPSNARVDGGQAAATDHVAAAGKIFKSESLNGDFSSPRRSRGLQDFPTNQGPGQSGTAASRDWAPASAHGLGLSVSHQESPYAPVFRWDLDPFDVDREQTAKLLDVYFAQSNVTIIPMFPRDAFLKWAHVGSKTADDVMLLYSLMLIGSIGSSHHRLEIEDRLEETVTMALSRCKSRCTLQLAQSRLLLSCYFLLRGREFESFDALGGAACVLLKLGYNKKQANREPKTEYGLEYESFERCCDRTFWCALVFEVRFTLVLSSGQF